MNSIVKSVMLIVLSAFVIFSASAQQSNAAGSKDLLADGDRNNAQKGFAAVLADKGSNQQMTAQDSDLVQIVNSGSTNSAGFDLKIQTSGSVLWSFTGAISPKLTAQMSADGGKHQLDAQLTKRLFANIEAAMPFTQYRNRGCAKSASFGYTLIVRYKGEDSPDLSCPLDDPKLIAVNEDLKQILDKLNLGGQLPRR